MQIQNYILLFEAALLLALAFYVFFRNPGQKVPQAFFVMTFGAGVWVGSNGLYDFLGALFWDKMRFLGAILVIVGFYYLSYHFPYRLTTLKWFEQVAVLVPAIILIIVLYSTTLFTAGYPADDIKHRGPFYDVFAVYFLFVLLYSIIQLAKKYKRSEGVHLWQIRNIFYAVGISFFAGVTTNLILPWVFNNQNFEWVGPMFSIFYFGFCTYILFKRKAP